MLYASFATDDADATRRCRHVARLEYNTPIYDYATPSYYCHADADTMLFTLISLRCDAAIRCRFAAAAMPLLPLFRYAALLTP